MIGPVETSMAILVLAVVVGLITVFGVQAAAALALSVERRTRR